MVLCFMPSVVRRGLAVVVLGLASWGTSWAYDNGAQVLDCDYRFGSATGSGRCRIVGSGMNQGVAWVVFEVQGRRFRYLDASEDQLEEVDRAGRTLRSFTIERSSGRCRQGRGSADIYDFERGDQVCLYWPEMKK